MKQAGEDESLRQLVIVRRKRGGDHDGHHGGVWKIAYADFMTAMMAFFLVMWLVGMTDDKTLVQVAAYFNPLRLSDRTPSQKGLHDAKQLEVKEQDKPSKEKSSDKAKSDAQPAPTKAQKREEKKAKVKAAHAEAELFLEPTKTLHDASQKASGAPTEVRNTVAVLQAEAETKYPLDPFDPSLRNPRAIRDVIEPLTNSQIAAPITTLVAHPARLSKASGAGDSGPGALPRPGNTQVGSDGVPPTASANSADYSSRRNQAKQLEADIKNAMAGLVGPHPSITVQATPDGVLINLSDDSEFGMFAIASAEPLPHAVLVMERISEVLKKQPGAIVVRGHTDGRPYRTSAYDNWRLSTARAHMAHYMLLRGGLDEARFQRIEGHADRNPLISSNKDADQNRRIEILFPAGSS